MATPIWLARRDLEAATSVRMVQECFEDDGVFNEETIFITIRRGEAQVMSRLVVEFGPPPISAAKLKEFACDDFLKFAALDYAVAYMFDKHPEYVRTAGMQKDRESRFKAADAQMDRFLNAEQQPSTLTRPANVGGVVVDGAHRLYTPDPNGRSNAGDY